MTEAQMTGGMRVDANRLLGRLADLAEVGATEADGCARLALTDDDKAGRDLVVSWMKELGLDVRIDAIGNVVAQRPGRDDSLAPVMCGSHIDTVRTGGRYDGNYGVLAGLEVIETLERAGHETVRPLAVAFFTALRAGRVRCARRGPRRADREAAGPHPAQDAVRCRP
jgi:beta-ureidopropionase / N-carbamoyl-L-amino-acid hydrolase